jgi:hypothetical protein
LAEIKHLPQDERLKHPPHKEERDNGCNNMTDPLSGRLWLAEPEHEE